MPPGSPPPGGRMSPGRGSKMRTGCSRGEYRTGRPVKAGESNRMVLSWAPERATEVVDRPPALAGPGGLTLHQGRFAKTRTRSERRELS